jgi:hypothetical protein
MVENTKTVTITMSEDQADLLSSYLSESEEHLLDAFEWADPDGKQFYEILNIVESVLK